MKSLALLAITAYQKYLSPRKGFCCAYRSHTGGQSCSVLGFRAIRRYGVWEGMAVLRQRLARCGTAHRRYTPRLTPHHHHHHHDLRQGGFCDLSCDMPCDATCDVSPGHCMTQGWRFLDCASYTPCDCCDWGRSKKTQEEEKYIYIPPKKSAKTSTIDIDSAV